MEQVPGGTGDLSLLADDAIDRSDEDRLDRIRFARRMVDLLDHVADQTNSAVCALLGPWGSGKTSVLHLVHHELDLMPGWRVAEFNPWQLTDLSALIREFLLTIRSVLPKGKTGTRARKALAGYSRKLAPFASIVSVPGIDPSKALELTSELLAGDVSLEGQRTELEAALMQHGQRVLVLIDDVDRLQSDELATVLKLVRLVGRLPSLYYVLAFDEATVLDVLQVTQVAARDRRRALAYLDKIVQVRLDLPPAHPLQVSRLTDLALGQLISRYDITLTDADLRRIAHVYHETMRHILTEARHVKRYFGQVDAFLALVHDEVDFVDFLIVSFLRTFFPELYNSIRHFKGELTGTAFEVRRLSADERMSAWKDRVKKTTPDEHVDRVLDLLAELFAPIGAARSGMSGSGSGYNELAISRRVGSSEYFDRYFYLTVPPDDVSDALVKASLTELAAGSRSEATNSLVDSLPLAAEPILDKLRRFSPTDAATTRLLLPFAAEMVAHAPEKGLLGRTRIVAEGWFAELLGTADLRPSEPLLHDLLEVASLYQLGEAMLRVQRHRASASKDLTVEQVGFRDLIVDQIKEQLEAQAIRPVEETEDVIGLLYIWSGLAGASTPREWLRMRASRAPWTVDSVVALFTSTARIIGTGTRVLSGFNSELLDELLGMDYVLEQFTPSPPVEPIRWHVDDDTSFEERRRRAHAVLARIAAERVSGSSEQES